MYTFERYSVKAADIVAFSCFFAGAITCLGISAGFHLTSNHSPQVARLGNQVRDRSLATVHEDLLMLLLKLDYAGIVALITGSTVPSIYVSFFDLIMPSSYHIWNGKIYSRSISHVARFLRHISSLLAHL